jgi:hypothetical protein
MRRIASWVGAGLACCAAATMASPAHAAKLTVTIANGDAVTMVAAIQRWDEDGNERKKINKDAKIDKPEADALAQKDDQRNWVFENLPEGRCDLVILAGTKRRIEGFDYPPVLEFDPFFPSNATVEEETRDFIVDHIKKSPHYENKVEPLYFGGDKKAVRDAPARQADQLRSRHARRRNHPTRNLAILVAIRGLDQAAPYARPRPLDPHPR